MNLSYFQDIKNGGTPLHWAKTKEIVVALIEAGCHIDAKNFKGDTALHTMVRNGRLECVMALISYGSNLNLKDSDGNTALHIACQEGYDIIVKALLIFDADFETMNEKNESAWNVALSKATTDASLMDFKDRKGLVYLMYSIGANGDQEMPEKFKQSKKASKVCALKVSNFCIIFVHYSVLQNKSKSGTGTAQVQKASGCPGT